MTSRGTEEETSSVDSEGEENKYKADFDPKVSANEEEDPKKFIQQLTGKLSQSLRAYNNELPRPDVELNKYVAGMILKQSTDGLCEEDIKSIITKLKTAQKEHGVEAENTAEDSENSREDETDENFNESIDINEITNSVINDINNGYDGQIIDTTGYNKTPFLSPSFN